MQLRRIAFALVHSQSCQRGCHRHVRIDDAGSGTPQPQAPGRVRVDAVLGVNTGQTRETRSRRPIHQRLRIVGVHDVRAGLRNALGHA